MGEERAACALTLLDAGVWAECVGELEGLFWMKEAWPTLASLPGNHFFTGGATAAVVEVAEAEAEGEGFVTLSVDRKEAEEEEGDTALLPTSLTEVCSETVSAVRRLGAVPLPPAAAWVYIDATVGEEDIYTEDEGGSMGRAAAEEEGVEKAAALAAKAADGTTTTGSAGA